MRCNNAMAQWIASLADGEAAPGWVVHHVAVCDRCRAETRELALTWQQLGKLPRSYPVPDDLDQWFAALLAKAESENEPHTSTKGDTKMLTGRMSGPRAGVLAAAAVALLLIGALVGRITGADANVADASVPAADTTQAQFLLLLHEREGTQPTSPEEMEAMVDEYRQWANRLADEARLVSAEKLADDGGRWVGTRSASAPLIGGFFLIRASDYAEAEAIAAASPHVKYGGVVEVRLIEKT